MSVDRLQELRKKRGRANQSEMVELVDVKPNDKDVEVIQEDGGGDVDQQLQLYKPINALIEDVRKATEGLTTLQGRDAKTTDDKSRKKIMAEMTQLVNNTMAQAGAVKNALQEIKEINAKFDAEEGNQNSARSQVRNNLYQSTCRRFQEHMAEFTDAREAFRVSVAERMARQVQIVDPSKTQEQALKLVENGEADQIITKALASDNLKEVVQELRARNQELLMLQRNVESLYEMFKDLHALIEMQGESLNIIEQRISRSLDYVQRGEEHLKKAKEHQKKAGKLKCILLLILVVIAIIVLTPILITSTSK